ncbi:aspartyl protease family protein 1 isoform X1 [Vigna radiata var. radiata]|uniref:Aspartyl protease family protein 1 isoform X1 n=1 Tax=Vigna radiata var. radiata TaxID=3916 RepID=A0A1S3USE8_VIGRR|nr:aspartyl protease family protein 1 isoform X1 [Vigna radiata var. radiata]
MLAFVFVLVVTFISLWEFCQCHDHVYTFTMHHRHSEPVRKWSHAAAGIPPPPEKGTVEYYAELADRDRFLRGRKLSQIDAGLAFSDGNSTFRISSLGFLHYTTVEIGTPGVKFMVALDTGSDLFWVPCDCTRCAATDSPAFASAFASDFDLQIYNPNGSSTSKKVTCNNSLCMHRSQCPGTFSNCPYMVSYVSAETSTSGILVEDVLHLTKEDNHHDLVEANVIFGCGQIQSGSFLDVAAPNGLFGLGMEKISVPSMLSREGFTADSFSMCFGSDGIGRISFGDKGSFDQDETPFNLNPSHPTYNVTVTQVRVGTTLIDVEFTALFDSGTSFTYLVDPTYTRLTESFHSQVHDRRRPSDSRIPFEYCYDMSPDANTSLIPSVSLTMGGGSHFAVYDPIIIISTQSELVYCLAVVKSSELNIIGQNFMTGYRVVFDREKLVLGWKKFDCYDIEDRNAIPIRPHSHADVPPAVAAGLGHYPATDSSTKSKYNSQRSTASSPSSNYTGISCVLFCLYSIIIHLYGAW